MIEMHLFQSESLAVHRLGKKLQVKSWSSWKGKHELIEDGCRFWQPQPQINVQIHGGAQHKLAKTINEREWEREREREPEHQTNKCSKSD